MTETRRNRQQSFEEFAREALNLIRDIRAVGAYNPQEIAMALNRSGFPHYSGHQWNAETVAEFLGDGRVQAMADRLDR